jgi:AI-2 transport protein TqsA
MATPSGPFPRLSGSYGALKEEQSWLVTASLMVIAAVAGGAALMYMRPVMVPFVLSLFFFYLVAPFADLMEQRLRAPRWMSVLVTLLLVAGILALLALLITTSASGLAASADIYREKLVGFASRAFALLDRYGVDLGQESFLESLGQLPISRILRTTAGTVVGIVTNGFLVLIFVIFLLIGRRPRRTRSALYTQIDAKVRKFILTKSLISAATGIMVGVILAILGLDLALVFGVLAFLLNFVPSVGSVVATLLPLPVALVQYDSLVPVILAIALPGAVQITMGNAIEPKIMGEGLDLSPVTILVALVFWGIIWGIVGMLLAAPITAVLRIILARFRTTRAVAEVLAGRFPGEVESS